MKIHAHSEENIGKTKRKDKGIDDRLSKEQLLSYGLLDINGWI